MLSRALSLAAVTLLIGCCTAGLARAQENLEAGKSPSQIFAGTCTACHKSPRGLLKTVAAGSLPGFLRQHYTTSPEMAGVLSSYLTSNGATDTRLGAGQAKEQVKDGKDKGGKDGAKEAKSEANLEAKPEARPGQRDRFGHRLHPAPSAEADAPADEVKPARSDDEIERPARKRLARPAEAPAEVAKPEVGDGLPAQAAGLRGRDGRKLSAKQKLAKRSRPGADTAPKEPPRSEEPAASVLPRSDSAKVDADKPEAAKPESPEPQSPKPEATRPEATKPATDEPSQSATIEPPRETGTLRPDPTAPVTPAPAVDAASSSMSAPSSGSGSEPAASPPPLVASPPPAVTAAAPAPQPSAPAGPPVPPISQ
ncbi:hypothetical protein [Bradyrhizobium sp.]|uniref:hypothetical protein n=1 Tax=Bradyrhizobium sp. TaxID=376 RepID=UPI003C59498C